MPASRRPWYERKSSVNILAVRRAAGVLRVIVPLGFTVCFTPLRQLFAYPDILRQPTAAILAKFAAGGTRDSAFIRAELWELLRQSVVDRAFDLRPLTPSSTGRPNARAR